MATLDKLINKHFSHPLKVILELMSSASWKNISNSKTSFDYNSRLRRQQGTSVNWIIYISRFRAGDV